MVDRNFRDSIRVTLDSETETQAILRCSIRDTGIGIPQDRVDRLFLPFTQIDSSTTRKYGGTGLGLAIAKQLAEEMGGTIGVESQEGQGATFWFTARLAKQAECMTPLSPDVEKLKALRVLVVDDNMTNRAILEAYLEN